jgi:serine/threonine protein kinase
MPEDYLPEDEFCGTFAYAPPRYERISPLKPSIDIWSLAATVQQFALNIYPTQSRAAFIRDRQQTGLHVPATDDFKAWNTDHWRSRRPDIYRPLNISGAELQRDWDVDERDHRNMQFHKPYSLMLNNLYLSMFDAQPESRMMAAHLVKYVVPLIEQQPHIERQLALATEGFDLAVSLKESGDGRQEGQGRGKWKRPGKEKDWVPSYEGNSYGV